MPHELDDRKNCDRHRGSQHDLPGVLEPAGFWRDILGGHDRLTEVPRTHWLREDYFDAKPGTPDKVYVSRGGFVPDVERHRQHPLPERHGGEHVLHEVRRCRVFAAARAAGIPIAWVLAGGYTKDITKVVEVHANTFAAAARVFS